MEAVMKRLLRDLALVIVVVMLVRVVRVVRGKNVHSQ